MVAVLVDGLVLRGAREDGGEVRAEHRRVRRAASASLRFTLESRKKNLEFLRYKPLSRV